MSKIKKFFAAVVAIMALTAMSVIPAFAASNVTMYAYDEDTDAYVSSSHANACVYSCTDNGDGTYYIVFKVITNMGATGYISEFDGKTVTYASTEEGALSNPFRFTPNPTISIDNNPATLTSFTVKIKAGLIDMEHPYSNGAIVIK